jgi:hypothetical protein
MDEDELKSRSRRKPILQFFDAVLDDDLDQNLGVDGDDDV